MAKSKKEAEHQTEIIHIPIEKLAGSPLRDPKMPFDSLAIEKLDTSIRVNGFWGVFTVIAITAAVRKWWRAAPKSASHAVVHGNHRRHSCSRVLPKGTTVPCEVVTAKDFSDVVRMASDENSEAFRNRMPQQIEVFRECILGFRTKAIEELPSWVEIKVDSKGKTVRVDSPRSGYRDALADNPYAIVKKEEVVENDKPKAGTRPYVTTQVARVCNVSEKAVQRGVRALYAQEAGILLPEWLYVGRGKNREARGRREVEKLISMSREASNHTLGDDISESQVMEAMSQIIKTLSDDATLWPTPGEVHAEVGIAIKAGRKADADRARDKSPVMLKALRRISASVRVKKGGEDGAGLKAFCLASSKHRSEILEELASIRLALDKKQKPLAEAEAAKAEAEAEKVPDSWLADEAAKAAIMDRVDSVIAYEAGWTGAKAESLKRKPTKRKPTKRKPTKRTYKKAKANA